MHNLTLPARNNFDTFSQLYKRRQHQPISAEELKSVFDEAEKEYRINCQSGNFTYASSVRSPSSISPEVMVSLFNSQLKRGKGRKIYEEIVEGSGCAVHCAFCDIRDAESLDHFKSKMAFPLLAVYPGNLIPACLKCNSALGQLGNKYHPYFDPTPSDDWLLARLDWPGGDSVPGVEFHVNSKFSPDAALVSRVRESFNVIGLGRRWANEMSTPIANMYRKFESEEDVEYRKFYVKDLLSSHSYGNPGPFKAFYQEILSSDWITHQFST